MTRGKRLVSSLRDAAELSQRDDRTEPGVLAPGTDKVTIRPEGAAGWIVSRETRKRFGTDCLPPLQGGVLMSIIPGLKPRAESFYPFGISSLPTGVGG